jgi:hypothetical protein
MTEHLGFTGTKAGMTKEQQKTVMWLLKEFEPINVHHGCCIGADEEFHDLVERWTTIVRHLHPPTKHDLSNAALSCSQQRHRRCLYYPYCYTCPEQ